MKARWNPKLLTLVSIALAVGLLGIASFLGQPPRESYEDQFEQALALFNRGDLERVSEIQERLDGKPGFQNHALLLQGAVLLRNKKYSESLAAFSRVVPSGGLREPTMLLTGECLYRMGRLAEAERTLRQLVSINPDQVFAHRWLGAIYYDLGAYDLAIAELETVSRLDPGDYRPHRLIGLMRLDFEEFQKAIDHYRKALELSPPPIARDQISRDLAKAHVAKKEFHAALKILVDMEKTADDLALMSECHWSLGESQRAKKLLAKARSLNANARSVLFLEARILRGDGEHEKALAPLTKVLQRDPQDAECRYQLALVYRKLRRQEDYVREIDRWKKTKRLMERLTELNIEAIRRPSDAAIREELSKVCGELGKHELSKMWKQAAEASRQLGIDQQRVAPRTPKTR